MAKEQIYKTANGKSIDLQQLISKNGNTRAVGNMNVNARGDVLDNSNKTISTRTTQVNKQYNKQTRNIVKDSPIVASKKPATETVDEPIFGLDETESAPPTKGLASAINKVKKQARNKKPKKES